MIKKLLLLIIAVLFIYAMDSSTKDTTRVIVAKPSTQFFPFQYDTVDVGDTIYSSWYWINNPALEGIGSITYVIDSIGSYNIATKLYRIFTNDTTWNAEKWILVDSVVSVTRTTSTLNFYGAKWCRFALVGWQRVNANDKSKCKIKFTIK